MEKFHEIIMRAKDLANRRGLQGKVRQQAMQNYVSEELDRELAGT